MSFHLKNTELIRFQVFCWQTASQNRVSLVTPIIMAISLITSEPNSITKILHLLQLNQEALLSDLLKILEQSLPKRRPKTIKRNTITISEKSKEVIKIANEIGEIMGDPTIGPHHILLSLLKYDHIVSEVFNKYGVTFAKFRKMVVSCLSVEKPENDDRTEKIMNAKKPTQKISPDNHVKSNEKDILSKCCIDLTSMALQGKLDPVIGRDVEITRLMTTLGRRKKNNAILVGEPGVGKTAVVEGLAQKIALGTVPETLKGFKIFQMDMTAVLGKTIYRGQFEDRIHSLLEIFIANKNYILFVDEIHTIVGAGGGGGGLDAANIMKPALANGTIRCVGATTDDEYRRLFKKDGALDRRFQRILINEPSKEETIQILIGIKPIIEKHHNCIITDAIVKFATELAMRYILDRHLPDKVIDCLDEACSHTVLKKHIGTIEVSKEDIVSAISAQTNIPKHVIGVDDVNRVRQLGGFLKNKIIGQDAALESITNILLGSYAGMKNPKKPMGCIVIGGPSGSGTTFASEKIAEGLFDAEDALIRINMSEFTDKLGNTKLIGSPPGYVGYGDKNQLTDKVARNQHCLILLDGIENANDEIVKLFIQAMSKGVITDASGHDVSFQNAVIIMTMTCEDFGKKYLLGFCDKPTHSIANEKRSKLIDACRKKFGEEFVNCIDEFVAFDPLEKSHLAQIVKMRMHDLSQRLFESGLKISYTDAVLSTILEKTMHENKLPAIKELDNYIKKHIETIISRFIIDYRNTDVQLLLDFDGQKFYCACQEAITAPTSVV